MAKWQDSRCIDYQKRSVTPLTIEQQRQSRLWAILGLAVLVLAICRSVLATPPGGSAASSVLPRLVNHVPEQLLVKPKAHVSEAAFQGLIRGL